MKVSRSLKVEELVQTEEDQKGILPHDNQSPGLKHDFFFKGMTVTIGSS